ncbi:deleted in malignant brain tumors 1 protein-like [Saccostrea echinata]|uniref:deleted in malignant brain tumors 1 protein-like n=1 Tax=Saccostrea echinata TaxID=191078 RepID=UPI002A838752|nr:deleted in malignant brain tumors 1 protein-like [Saccostrea echinata]
MQKFRFVQCLVFLILQNVFFGLSVLTVNNTETDVSSLSPTRMKESGILLNILNQESVVRFSMVQKMQEFTMDVIEIKKNNDLLIRKLQVLTEEQITSKEKITELRKENENMKQQLSALQNDVNGMNITLEKVSIICETHGKEISDLKRIRLNQRKDVTDIKANLAENKQEMDHQRTDLKIMEDELQTWSLSVNSTIQEIIRDLNGSYIDYVSIHGKVTMNSKNLQEQRSELDVIHSDLTTVRRQLEKFDRFKIKSNLIDPSGTKIDEGVSRRESFKETDNLWNISVSKDGVRLVNGESWMEGRVEIYEGGHWGTICDQNWNTRDASVVCKTIGFSYGIPVVSGRFGSSMEPVVMGNVSCDGSEMNIRTCLHSSAQICENKNTAGVVCTDNPPIRLVNGPSEFEGRVEIYTDSDWGTVCDEGWDNREASVVCRILGYKEHNALARFGGYFGLEIRRSSVFGIHCEGTENDVQKCGNNTLNKVSCSNGTHAGVSCLPIRLVNGRDTTEGRVEVLINNEWGTVCNNGWDVNDAKVVCRNLGLPSANAVARSSSYFGQGDGKIWFDNLDCLGTEHEVLNCSHGGIGVHNCTHDNDAGVSCLHTRLMGGRDETEGRVEVYINDEWGTVCDDDWDNSDAQVVCRSVGFPSYTGVAIGSASFGQGSGRIWLDNVGCTGREDDIRKCRHSSFGTSDCHHSEDAGVRCVPLRLVNGSSKREGRVEVHINNQWGTVCDTDWTQNDAQVVCETLGYSGHNVVERHSAYFGEGSGDILLHQVHCTGKESNLLTCSHGNVPTNNCSHSKDAGVSCLSVRLVGGKTRMEGRVEVLIRNEWGTICDTNWDKKDAAVICRTLGFDGFSGVARSSSYYGKGSGRIWLDNVGCHGNEMDIFKCRNKGVGIHNCQHSNDAGVSCVPTRLVGGKADYEGRVEVYINKEWGTICDDGWDDTDAGVVCRSLGYLENLGKVINASSFKQGSEQIWMTNVACFGSENDVISCRHDSMDSRDCSHDNKAAISCSNRIRLMNGRRSGEGRVEVFINNEWGTVCDDDWDNDDAKVVCRSLGLQSSNAVARIESYFGAGSGQILLDNVHCTGFEKDIMNCRHPGVGIHDCGASEHAGVTCG